MQIYEAHPDSQPSEALHWNLRNIKNNSDWILGSWVFQMCVGMGSCHNSMPIIKLLYTSSTPNICQCIFSKYWCHIGWAMLLPWCVFPGAGKLVLGVQVGFPPLGGISGAPTQKCDPPQGEICSVPKRIFPQNSVSWQHSSDCSWGPWIYCCSCSGLTSHFSLEHHFYLVWPYSPRMTTYPVGWFKLEDTDDAKWRGNCHTRSLLTLTTPQCMDSNRRLSLVVWGFREQNLMVRPGWPEPG